MPQLTDIIFTEKCYYRFTADQIPEALRQQIQQHLNDGGAMDDLTPELVEAVDAWFCSLPEPWKAAEYFEVSDRSSEIESS